MEIDSYLIDLIKRMSEQEKGICSSEDSVRWKASIQFYIDKLTHETDKYVLSHMLDRLMYIEKEQSIDISPIIQCTESEKWLVRYSAIDALNKTNHEIARLRLREIVQLDDQKKHKYEIVHAIVALGQVGEIGDVELLKPFLSSRIPDIKGSAKWAIECICHGTYPVE